MTSTRRPPLHEAAELALSHLVAGFRVVLDEDRDRPTALDAPPAPGFVRVARLVPDGTDGESLTVVSTKDGGVSVYVRRSLDREYVAGERQELVARELVRHVLALAPGLGWTRRP